jgi:hypothetical protein
MSEKKKCGFVDLFVAYVKGDDAEVLAIKTKKQATAGLKVQIANMEGDTEDFNQKIEDAKENLAAARINFGNRIEDRSAYVKTLVGAYNAVGDAEEDFKSHLDTVSFLKEELKNM